LLKAFRRKPILLNIQTKLPPASSNVTMTFGWKLNWLVLVETMLAFAEAKRNQFWAGDFHVLVSSCLPPVDGKRDTGLAVLRGLESLLHNARKRCEVGWEDDFLKGTAAAYLLICDVVNACIPVTMNGIAATKALLRKWRDLTVIHCACLTGVSDEVSFMRVLDVAFGGLLQPLVQANRDLNSSLLQSYQKMLAHCDGAFSSRSTKLAHRRGWVRPRKARGLRSADALTTATTTDDSAAAAASSDSVEVSTQTGSVVCSYEGGVCHIVPSASESTLQSGWYAPFFSIALGHTLQCDNGHTISQEHLMQYDGSGKFNCPMCNKPLYLRC
jgi:hypothetical protein